MATYTDVFNPLMYMGKKNRKQMALRRNNLVFIDYFNRLQEIALNVYEWKNLPETVDERYIELTLCNRGYGIYFTDEIIGNVFTQATFGGNFNIYKEPLIRRAYAMNGYSKELDISNSVMVYNNYLRQPTIETIILYASRLAEIERTIEVNIKAQKTPVAIICDEHELLTYKNVYEQYDGNMPLILGAKNLDLSNIKVMPTNAPYVADKLQILKRQVWNEALSFLGVENANTDKKERMVSDEIISNLGGVQAQRFMFLNARRQAARKINNMFGTNIEVNFREDLNMYRQITEEV